MNKPGEEYWLWLCWVGSPHPPAWHRRVLLLPAGTSLGGLHLWPPWCASWARCSLPSWLGIPESPTTA